MPTRVTYSDTTIKIRSKPGSEHCSWPKVSEFYAYVERYSSEKGRELEGELQEVGLRRLGYMKNDRGVSTTKMIALFKGIPRWPHFSSVSIMCLERL